MKTLVFLFMFCTSVVFGTSLHTVYKVGGSDGWTNGGVDCKSWSASKHFQVGDVISFEYNKEIHNVVRVSPKNFNSCNATFPQKTFNSGYDSFTIKKPGHYYFVCSFGDHCKDGQKVDIRVVRSLQRYMAPDLPPIPDLPPYVPLSAPIRHVPVSSPPYVHVPVSAPITSAPSHPIHARTLPPIPDLPLYVPLSSPIHHAPVSLAPYIHVPVPSPMSSAPSPHVLVHAPMSSAPSLLVPVHAPMSTPVPIPSSKPPHVHVSAPTPVATSPVSSVPLHVPVLAPTINAPPYMPIIGASNSPPPLVPPPSPSPVANSGISECPSLIGLTVLLATVLFWN